jgi:hypothetical protein
VDDNADLHQPRRYPENSLVLGSGLFSKLRTHEGE